MPAQRKLNPDHLPQPRVAVIGPFRNSESHVKAWVEGLSQQTYPNFCVYVLDDASTDSTGRLLQHYFSRSGISHVLFQRGTNIGPSAARNVLIRRALSDGSDLILLLDADCRVSRDWIAEHVRAHGAQPEMALVGGAIQGRAHSYVGQADGFGSWFTAVPHSKSREMTWMHLSSTNLSIRAEVFHTIGFFDETLSTGEDVAFCRSARKAGFRIWFHSNLIITHLDREKLADARRHHYRWGLHSYTLSTQAQGGYYSLLMRTRQKWMVAALVPVIAALNVALIVKQYALRSPKVLFFLPMIAYLKWWNARGVYDGYVDPSRCRLPGSTPDLSHKSGRRSDVRRKDASLLHRSTSP